MMLSPFGSFLEFIAAIYTSMYFDRVFDFWSPKYKKNLSFALKKNNWTKDTLFSNNMEAACSKWYDGVKRTMLNKAAFMVISIVLVLVFIGFEDSLEETVLKVAYSSLVLTWATTFVFVILIFRRFFFSKVKTMFLALFFEIAVFVFAFGCVVPRIPSLLAISSFNRMALLLFTLLPLVIQIMSSWLSSAPYAKYLEKRLPRFKKEYDIAQMSLKTRDISLVNDDFKEVITTMFVQGENSDTSIQRYQELLRDKMLATCQPRSILIVFGSWIVFQYEYLKNKLLGKGSIKAIEEVVYEVPAEFRGHSNSVDFSEEYKKYCVEKGNDKKLSIRGYCKKNNISSSAMISWLKKNNPADI